VLRSQRNARVHLAIGIAALLLAVALRVPPIGLSIIVVCGMVVIATEMINTVVEAVVDLVTANVHPLAKIAKDVAAGAVLVTATGSVIVGLLVIGPYLWHALTR
jgi:diacylglycerol kinase